MAEIQIINRVFDLLGRNPQGSVLEDEWGNIISNTIDAKLKIILESSAWSFAIGYEELGRNTSISNPSYIYQYPFPINCTGILNAFVPYNDENGVLRISTPMQMHDYEITSKLLYTNVTRCLVKYKTGNIVAAEQEQSFIDALAYLAAAECAITLAENAGLSKQLMTGYASYKILARKNDIQPGATRRFNMVKRYL